MLVVGMFMAIAGIIFIPLSIKMGKVFRDFKYLAYTEEERDEISKSIEASVRDLGECYKNEIERLSESSKVPPPA